MKRTSLVLAISALLGGCIQQGPSDADVMAASQVQISRLDRQMCVSLAAPSQFVSHLPMSDSILVPSKPVKVVMPGVIDKMAEQFAVLEKAGLVSAEQATYATEDEVIPATRYRFTDKGEAAFPERRSNYPCLNVGHLVATSIQPLEQGQSAVKQLNPDADPVATRTVNVEWKDKPDWLTSPEGEIAFAGNTPVASRALESGLAVTLVEGRTGKWHEQGTELRSGIPSAKQSDTVPLKDTEADLIHKADMIEHSARVPHDELTLPLTITDTQQFKEVLGDGIFIADHTPPHSDPSTASFNIAHPRGYSSNPGHPTQGVLPNACAYRHTPSPQDRNEAREFFDILAKTGAITRKASSEVDPKLPKGWVYYVPSEADEPSYYRQPQLDLGTFTLSQHATVSRRDPFFTADIPFTLDAPPAWLAEAAKHSPYFAQLAKGGTVNVMGSIRNGHYELNAVGPRGTSASYY